MQATAEDSKIATLTPAKSGADTAVHDLHGAGKPRLEAGKRKPAAVAEEPRVLQVNRLALSSAKLVIVKKLR